MKKALRLARDIGRRKTVFGRRKAVLAWCSEMKRVLSVSGEIGLSPKEKKVPLFRSLPH